jgi:hypothetical protein
MDAGGGVGLIKGRKFCHVKVTRPRFKAGSIKFAGNQTCAFDRFDLVISSRSPSGQSSESAASGAEMAAGSIGACGAIGAIGATGAAGFDVPLPLLPLLFCGAATLIVGVWMRGMNGGGGGGMEADEATGVTIRDGGVGIRDGGVTIRDGGVGNRNGGVGNRNGGVGEAAGGLTGAVEILIPWPRSPNGLPISSSVNSTCFCVTRRASNAGFSR